MTSCTVNHEACQEFASTKSFGASGSNGVRHWPSAFRGRMNPVDRSNRLRQLSDLSIRYWWTLVSSHTSISFSPTSAPDPPVTWNFTQSTRFQPKSTTLLVPSAGIRFTLTALPSLNVRMPELTLAVGSARSLSTTLRTLRGWLQASLIHGVRSPDDAHSVGAGALAGRPSIARTPACAESSSCDETDTS